MKTVYLLRHAKSSWKNSKLDDHDRPLNKRGKRDAPMMGKFMKKQGIMPELTLCSSSKRTRKTAKLVAKKAGLKCQVRRVKELYLAEPHVFMEWLHNLPSDIDSIMFVGHNPGLEEFLTELTGTERAMPTACLAKVELPATSWTDVRLNQRGSLAALWRPHDIRANQD